MQRTVLVTCSGCGVEDAIEVIWGTGKVQEIIIPDAIREFVPEQNVAVLLSATCSKCGLDWINDDEFIDLQRHPFDPDDWS